MIRILPTGAPTGYAHLISAGATFASLSSNPAIRQALWSQQGGRCAYCECRLKDPSSPNHNTRIEHFHPQSSGHWNSRCAHQCRLKVGENSKAPIAWGNLLLCCDGQQAAGVDFTCDKSKANTHICADFVNPKVWSSPRLLEIDRSGVALAVSGLPLNATNVINNILCLNAPHLIKARKTVHDANLRVIRRQGAMGAALTPSRRQQIRSALRTSAQTSEYSATLLSLADRF